ncbi:MAG: hypothetical protein EHM41_21000, partial [Chloroflexi bacterium]
MIVRVKQLKFNLLALLGVGLMIAGLLSPWWGFTTNKNTESFLYPYIIKGPVTGMIGYNRSSQMELLTAGLVVAILLGICGSFLHNRLGRLFLFLSGLITAAFIWRFFVRLTGFIEFYNVPLQGTGGAEYMGEYVAEATSSLQAGLYLSGAGTGIVILAIIV